MTEMSEYDIVDRLRATASNDPKSTYSKPIREAADEIERLRAALKEIAGPDDGAFTSDAWPYVTIAREALGDE